ncbi:MAG: hypothetical protein LBS73_00420 [Campylobacteraceae bacterium]|nr:hypothetical protein [Campylobacteraceae bacterium]
MRAYQPKSIEESLAILWEYKDKIPQKTYENIYDIICDFAIENMFLDREDIETDIKILSGEITLEKSIAETIDNFKARQSKAS